MEKSGIILCKWAFPGWRGRGRLAWARNAAQMLRVAISALPRKADIREGAAKRLLMTQSGHSALLTNVVADDATGEAGQDRRQGGPARSVRHLSACRGRDPENLVCRHPAADRAVSATA